MLPSTTSRMAINTTNASNRAIQNRMEQNILYYADNPHEIQMRLEALDQEWDIERILEANASTLSLVGVALGALVHRRWLLLPAAVTGFLLQHALQGWCPPLVILRRRGVRTATEIDRERYALKALRGDFDGLDTTPTANTNERVRLVMMAIG